jgi:hypothetical protein
MDNETMDNETMDNETMDNETMDNETMDNETMDNETMDNETMDNESASNFSSAFLYVGGSNNTVVDSSANASTGWTVYAVDANQSGGMDVTVDGTQLSYVATDVAFAPSNETPEALDGYAAVTDGIDVESLSNESNLELTVTYDVNRLAAEDTDELSISFYQYADGEWTQVDTRVDLASNTVSANFTENGTAVVLGEIDEDAVDDDDEEPTETETPAETETETTTETATETTTEETTTEETTTEETTTEETTTEETTTEETTTEETTTEETTTEETTTEETTTEETTTEETTTEETTTEETTAADA